MWFYAQSLGRNSQKPTDTIGKHRHGRPGDRILRRRMYVLRDYLLVVVCETSYKACSLGIRYFLDRNSRNLETFIGDL